MEYFRFENMEIWKDAISVSDKLLDIADKAEGLKFYRFAEQLRAASMSISNNIAEGSGSFSDKEFASFLNIARRSVFECANILHIFLRRKIISNEEKEGICLDLISISKRLTNFRKSLINN
ncbi:MAG TPA: four helix bundle protein [Bacteroidales bacterium]|nr:four helix bundle protein [Bacteroidales bacterium]